MLIFQSGNQFFHDLPRELLRVVEPVDEKKIKKWADLRLPRTIPIQLRDMEQNKQIETPRLTFKYT